MTIFDQHLESLRRLFTDKLTKQILFVSRRCNFYDDYAVHGFNKRKVDGFLVQTAIDNPANTNMRKYVKDHERDIDIVSLVVVQHASKADATSKLLDIDEYVDIVGGNAVRNAFSGASKVLLVDVPIDNAGNHVTDCAMASMKMIEELDDAGRTEMYIHGRVNGCVDD